MDDFKKTSFREVGPGGIKCPMRCCFMYYGEKNRFRRNTRNRLKTIVKTEIENGIDEFFSGEYHEE